MNKNSDIEAPRRDHPYLTGNFAPVQKTTPLTTCLYTGEIPQELAGGEYVRNGGNPVTNEELGRDAHWFDGDGMLSGVLFRRTQKGIRPEFANQYILTDVYLSSVSSPRLRTPILPSIATMVNPLTSILTIIIRVFRTLLLVLLSRLPGSQQVIQRISVANTAILYHDGRALATCESGPPMQIALPGLETVDWYIGQGEYGGEKRGEKHAEGFAGSGPLSSMREWSTAHPRTDPDSGELLLYHSTFVPPFVNYTIIKPTYDPLFGKDQVVDQRIIHKPVPGISSPKMMHDFGVSKTHTVIMDLPLSLNPLNIAMNSAVVSYDPTARSRFGVFPRYRPQDVRWFETKACCIFHTANTWNSSALNGSADEEQVNMLACRLTSATVIFSAGDIATPQPLKGLPPSEQEEDQCRLYYYQFDMAPDSNANVIRHQWALSVIPFEFPAVCDNLSMSAAKYVYGCSCAGTSFGAALGKAAKINSLVKMDVQTLIARGMKNPPTSVVGSVDTRDMPQILASSDPEDPIQVFEMPKGWYAQEPQFVPRLNGTSEDDGWLLSYVFDESQLGADGNCKDNARSEFWVIDARNMKDVVAKVQLPQRVPYGLHGHWFSEEEIASQRPTERLRSMPLPQKADVDASLVGAGWMSVRTSVEKFIA